MNPLHVQLQFLRLAKLFPTESTQRPGASRVGGATVRAVHVEVVKAEEELEKRELHKKPMIGLSPAFHDHLFTILALVRSLSVVLRRGVLHDVLLAQNGEPAHFAVVLADRQRELQVVEDRAMHAVVQRVRESNVAPAAVCK